MRGVIRCAEPISIGLKGQHPVHDQLGGKQKFPLALTGARTAQRHPHFDRRHARSTFIEVRVAAIRPRLDHWKRNTG
jgi:hypothetical protein